MDAIVVIVQLLGSEVRKEEVPCQQDKGSYIFFVSRLLSFLQGEATPSSSS